MLDGPAVTLQFVTESDPVSRGIRIFSHGPYSHVDGVLPDGSYLGAHASGGVAVRPPHYARWTKITRITIRDPSNGGTGAKAVYDAASAQVGKPYDFLDIAGILIGRNWRDQGRWICSELWAWALEGRMLPNPLPEAAAMIDPWFLFGMLCQLGDVQEIDPSAA